MSRGLRIAGRPSPLIAPAWVLLIKFKRDVDMFVFRFYFKLLIMVIKI